MLVAAAMLALTGVTATARAADPAAGPRVLLPGGLGAPPPAEPPSPAQAAPEDEAAGAQPQVLLPGRLAPSAATSEGAVEAPSALPGANAGQPGSLQSDAETVRDSGLLTTVGTIGWQDPARVGLNERLWAGIGAQPLARLMRAVPAPRASRNAHRLLARALAARVSAPSGPIAPLATAHIGLLLRMGEASSAKAVADRVPLGAYDEPLFGVAGVAQLAAMDLAGLCPLATDAVTFSRDTLWTLAQGACLALKGDEAGAALAIDIARKTEAIDPLDVELTDRVVNAISGGVYGGGLDWPAGARLTVFRAAMLAMSGTAPPLPALGRAPLPLKAWVATNPGLPLATRIAAARVAAGSGVMDGAGYIGLWSARHAELDPARAVKSRQDILRRAHAAPTYSERIEALRTLWAVADRPLDRVAMALLTARAAAGIPVHARHADVAPDLVRTLLLAGETKSARRWLPVLQAAAADGDSDAGRALIRLWPLFVVADTAGTARHKPALFDLWWDAIDDDSAVDRPRLGQLMAAATEGLGRGLDADAIDDLPRKARLATGPDRFGQRIATAARNRQDGLVILLAAAAVGQRPQDVDPSRLRALCAALRAIGQERAAALIAIDLLIQNGA